MNPLLKKSACELADLLRSGEITSVELTQACLDRIDAIDPKVHAFLYVDREGALATAADVDARRAAGEELPRLAGVPIAVKDNMVTRGVPTTCASKILEGWLPPYDATVVELLHKAGSAAAVSSFMAPLALGSDTGGSIRQPGAVTGTVGAKPTYGAVSRYGLIAMASSLDQIGPVTRTVEDAAALTEVIGGYDPHDSTSLNEPVPALSESVAQVAKDGKIEGLRVGVVRELSGEGYQDDVLEAFNATVEKLRAAGAEIVEVSCPSFDYALAAYYLIMPAEVSSNLARFDGMRYGIRVEPSEGPVTAERVMAATREAGFGDEVKRRIILGTHVLSAGFFDAYYGSAQKVRTLIQRDFARVFEEVDVLVSPTCPTTAFRFGEKMDDPMAMYLNDIATIPANLAGIPAMSVPNAVSAEGLPVGFQILAPAHHDLKMYEVASLVEQLSGDIAGNCPAAQWEEN